MWNVVGWWAQWWCKPGQEGASIYCCRVSTPLSLFLAGSFHARASTLDCQRQIAKYSECLAQVSASIILCQSLYVFLVCTRICVSFTTTYHTQQNITEHRRHTLFPVRIYNFHFTWIHKLFLVRTTSFCALLECTLLRYSNNRGALCMQRTINYSICCTNLFVLEQHYICCAHCAISSRHVICWVQT